ncbi:hypothetical protein H8356DRAFT_1688205 [Neocallimastix lanati (nom. inval.)]|jgi:hypothetical protein|uniref:SAP domain-containing protein n=1 Tax=Neocallimastix californiae TaxID=1754190 RepID=A0A1Y2AJF6_9FUNG|nr:hypothetical protein H8356DRAFT_1688205 [Neocallimastix sp. JGI-2020a]ORY22656.1 hypothetical protein LY90DRAFT_707080 [Neocallimastix californiae]|eukprot:ORY22656.1 hypothetical protein LY90DRAFT_707080 [Neocallimastix californiae]
MQYQTQGNMNFIVQDNSNQMVIDGGNGAAMQQISNDFEWLNLMDQDSQQSQQHWQQNVQRRPRANTIATAPVPSTQAQFQVVNQPQVMNQQQQMLNQQQIISQQQQQIMGQQQQIMGQQQIVSQPATIIINQSQPTTQQPILVQQQAQPAHIIVQQTGQPILVQTSPQTPTQQIIVQESVPVTTQGTQFAIIAQQGRQRANTIPGSTAPPYPPQNTTSSSSSPYNSSSQVKPTVSTPPVGKIAISSNHTKSIPATTSPMPGVMMNFPNKLSRDLFTQSEHLRKLDEELDKVDFDDVTVYELKELLRKRGLPSSGKKAILTERLLDEKRNAEVRKRNFLEAEELRKKGQLNMNGLCNSNQIMDLYGGITALTTQEIPVPNTVMASPTSTVALQPIMPLSVNQVKTRHRSYSDSRLTRPTIMETSPSINNSSQLKNQISFQDYNAMQTDSTTVVTTANQAVTFASPTTTTFQQVSVQPQTVVFAQQPQNFIQVQSTDASWNQNNMSKYGSPLHV